MAMEAFEPRANFEPTLPPIAVPAPMSRVRGDGYSRAVAFLKRLLPMIGAALLLLVAAWPRLAPLLETVRLTVSGIDLREARELNMLNPRYAGTDRLNRPYVITAAVGHQLPNHSDLMSLEKPRAEMLVHAGTTVVLTARTAMYQSQPQLLDLFDDVTLTHENGSRFVTQRAHANLANDTAEGNVPVEGHGPSGDIWGQGFRLLDKGNTIIFTGDSRAILRGTKPAKAVAQPPEPPAKVLQTAALVEVAAAATVSPKPAVPVALSPAQPTLPRARHFTSTTHQSARPHHLVRHNSKISASAGTPAARKVENVGE